MRKHSFTVCVSENQLTGQDWLKDCRWEWRCGSLYMWSKCISKQSSRDAITVGAGINVPHVSFPFSHNSERYSVRFNFMPYLMLRWCCDQCFFSRKNKARWFSSSSVVLQTDSTNHAYATLYIRNKTKWLVSFLDNCISCLNPTISCWGMCSCIMEQTYM